MMVDVVRNVLHSISATMTGGSARQSRPRRARALRAPSGLTTTGDAAQVETSTKRATSSTKSTRGVAGTATRHSSPAAASVTANANSRPAESDSGLQHARRRATGNKGTAKSAR